MCWGHQMETFSALVALCAGNSPVTGEFPAQRPVTRSFDVFVDLCLNKLLSKQSWGWWSEAPPRPLWWHCHCMYLWCMPRSEAHREIPAGALLIAVCLQSLEEVWGFVRSPGTIWMTSSGPSAANHSTGYFSNLACDSLSIVWANPEQETENGHWSKRVNYNIEIQRNLMSIFLSLWSALFLQIFWSS